MKLHERIRIDPAVMHGAPCIRGMRIRVQDILDMMNDGTEVPQILEDFPDLELDDILAAIEFERLEKSRLEGGGTK